MIVNLKDLDHLERFSCLDVYVRHTLTGENLLAAVTKNDRDIVSEAPAAQLLYEKFKTGIEMVANPKTVTAYHQEEASEELILALVNEAVHATCVNMYEKMKDKINSKNKEKSLKVIQEKYIENKENLIEN